MDVDEAYAEAKFLLGEKGVYWSPTDVLTHANRAYTYLHSAICKYDPQVFLTTSSVLTYAANAESYDLAAGLGVFPRSVALIRYLPNAGAIGPTNVPSLITQVDFGDLQRRYIDQQNFMAFSGVGSNGRAPAGWFAAITKERYLHIAPFPTQPLSFVVDYIPYPAALTGGGSVFGLPQRFLLLVPLLMTKFMTTKEKRGTLSLDYVLELVKAQLDPDGPLGQLQEIPYQSPY